MCILYGKINKWPMLKEILTQVKKQIWLGWIPLVLGFLAKSKMKMERLWAIFTFVNNDT